MLIEKERMEMFEADFCNMVMTVDELNGIMNKKTPAEYDGENFKALKFTKYLFF